MDIIISRPKFSYMVIIYIVISIIFISTSISCNRFNIPRIQDKETKNIEVLDPTPTPVPSLHEDNIIQKEENYKGDKPKEDNKEIEKPQTNNITLGDLYIDKIFGFSINYPINWRVNSTGSVPSIAEITFDSQNAIGDVYLVYTDGNTTDRDILNQFIEPIRQQQNFTINSEVELKLKNGNNAFRLMYQWGNSENSKTGFIQTSSDKIKNYIIIFEIDSNIFNQYFETINLLFESFDVFEPQPYDIPRYESLVLHLDTGPVSLDPAFATGAKSIQYIQQIFSGLTGFDKQGLLQPDLAESWTVSKDGKTYTFYIKKNAQYHSGRPVKSIDVQYSWERALKSENKNNVLNYLGDITGSIDFSEGNISNLEGFSIINDQQFQIELNNPTPHFLSKLSHSHTFIVDLEQIERYSSNNRAWEIEAIGTGPFIIGDWIPGLIMYLYPHQNYHLNKPQINSLIFRLYAGQPALMYQSGEIDATTLYSDEVMNIYNSDLLYGGSPIKESNLIKSTEMSTYYIGFNTQSVPFDDINVRKAFALASNSKQLVQEYFGDVHEIAYGLIPPEMPNYQSNLSSKNYKYDSDLAIEYLSKSKYYKDGTLPDIFYSTSGYDGPNRLIKGLIDSWILNLGVNITTNVYPPDQYYSSFENQTYDIYDYGWIADYPDPQNFLYSLFHSSAGNNKSNLNDPLYDLIIDQSSIENDQNIRSQYYKQAEDKLFDDSIIIPLYHGATFALIKEHVTDINFTPYGMLDLRDVKISNYLTISTR